MHIYNTSGFIAIRWQVDKKFLDFESSSHRNAKVHDIMEYEIGLILPHLVIVNSRYIIVLVICGLKE